MSGEMFYVCDSCGHVEREEAVPEDAAWLCQSCGSHAAWEFSPEKRLEAYAHGKHIERIAGTQSIFRGSVRR